MSRAAAAALVLGFVAAPLACSSSKPAIATEQPKIYATCADAKLTCAQNGACPAGMAFGTLRDDVTRTCNGTAAAEDCCGACAAPNVVEGDLCVTPGEAACHKLAGYCAEAPAAGGTAACDPGSSPVGAADLCGKGVPCCALADDGGTNIDAARD